MSDDPNDTQDQNESFGFTDAPPKDEKYDTRYVLANMQRENRRNYLMWAAIALVAIVAAIYLLSWLGASKPQGAEAMLKARESAAAEDEAPAAKAGAKDASKETPKPAPAATAAPSGAAPATPAAPTPK